MVSSSITRALALACLVAKVNAFAPSINVAKVSPSRLLMVDGPADGKKIPSGKKEIGYDSASGRFFETGRGAEECVPDDEYCVLDEDSGTMIRLTLAEKERIFLDALQVSAESEKCIVIGFVFSYL